MTRPSPVSRVSRDAMDAASAPALAWASTSFLPSRLSHARAAKPRSICHPSFARLHPLPLPLVASATPPQSQSSPSDLDAQYAEFADRLRLDAESAPLPTQPREQISKAVDKRPEVDPADYARFDSLLGGSGGKGRKPLKGGKRWVTSTTPPTNPPILADPDIVESPISTSQPEPARPPPARPVFSDAQAAGAYQFMSDQFGDGFHRTPAPPPTRAAPTPPIPAEPSEPLPPLAKPPRRPDDVSASRVPKPKPNPFFDPSFAVPSAEMPAMPDVELQPKPMRPSDVKPAPVSAVSATHPADRATDEVSAESLLPPPPKVPLQPKPSRPNEPSTESLLMPPELPLQSKPSQRDEPSAASLPPPPPDLPLQPKPTRQEELVSSDEIAEEVTKDPPVTDPSLLEFTKGDEAEGYAIMASTFGAGFHHVEDTCEETSKPASAVIEEGVKEGVDDPEEPIVEPGPTLATPPLRLSKLQASESTPESDRLPYIVAEEVDKFEDADGQDGFSTSTLLPSTSIGGPVGATSRAFFESEDALPVAQFLKEKPSGRRRRGDLDTRPPMPLTEPRWISVIGSVSGSDTDE